MVLMRVKMNREKLENLYEDIEQTRKQQDDYIKQVQKLDNEISNKKTRVSN